MMYIIVLQDFITNFSLYCFNKETKFIRHATEELNIYIILISNMFIQTEEKNIKKQVHE